MRNILIIIPVILFLFIIYLFVYREEYDKSEECKKCQECAAKYPMEGTINLSDKGCYDIDKCNACGDIIHGNVVSDVSPTIGRNVFLKDKNGSISKA